MLVTPPTDRRLANFRRGRMRGMCCLRSLLSICCLAAFTAAAAVADDLSVAAPPFESAPMSVPVSNEFTRGLRHYEAGRYEKAAAAFEKAAAVDPEDDRYAYWLGKACGRVAEHAGPLSALKWAGRTRDALERAVELNPDNRDAVASLADYYEQAPGFLGGDVAKAHQLRARLAASQPEAPALDAVAR